MYQSKTVTQGKVVDLRGNDAYKMIKNLISQSPHYQKRLLRSHRIDEHISMYTNEMLRIEYTVLILFTKARDKSEKGRSALQQAALGIETKREL